MLGKVVPPDLREAEGMNPKIRRSAQTVEHRRIPGCGLREEALRGTTDDDFDVLRFLPSQPGLLQLIDEPGLLFRDPLDLVEDEDEFLARPASLKTWPIKDPDGGQV